MNPAIDAIDHHEMAIAMLIGKAPADEPPDDRFAQLGGDDLLDAGAVEAALGQLALHEADDVTALAHAAERLFQPLGEPVTPAANVFGEIHRLELAQPASSDRLLEGIVVGWRHCAIGVHPT